MPMHTPMPPFHPPGPPRSPRGPYTPVPGFGDFDSIARKVMDMMSKYEADLASLQTLLQAIQGLQDLNEAMQTGFTGWKFSDGADHTLELVEGNPGWSYRLDGNLRSFETFLNEAEALAATTLTFLNGGTPVMTATRSAFPPTKTSQLVNDTGFANKASSATEGNLAALTADGNLADSGATPESIKAAAVAAVVNGADATMDTLKEIADILGSNQASGSVLKRILDLESGKVNKEAGKGLVAVDAALATSGAAADAKAVGDALRGGFTPWACEPATLDGESFSVVFRERIGEYEYWALYLGDQLIEDNYESDINPTELAFDGRISVTATRHLITPTKTSQLTNDGDGTNAFVKTNDSRLSDARTPTAHHATHATNGSDPIAPADIGAASAADLPYRLVTPGEWEFSGLSGDETDTAMDFSEGEWWLYLSFEGGESDSAGPVAGSENDLTVVFADRNITATRPSLPGHLLDRAGNRVVVTGDTTLTLPAAVPGHLRDFLVRLEVSGSRQVSFSPSSGVAYTGYGNPSGIYSAGTHLLRFTETAEGEFCVTDMLAEYADASALPYALVSKTPVSGAVSLSDRAVNLVNPTVTELPPVWEWSDGLDHGQPVYGVVYDDGGDYQEYAWGFQGEGDAPSSTDSFGYNYSFVYDGPDATELSFYNSDTYETIVASLVTRYETDVSSLSLPPAVTGKSRDFMVRLAMPENAAMFSWPSGVEYETEDGQMPDVSEPGVYLIAFTETGAGRFALLCRKVQGVP